MMKQNVVPLAVSWSIEQAITNFQFKWDEGIDNITNARLTFNGSWCRGENIENGVVSVDFTHCYRVQINPIHEVIDNFNWNSSVNAPSRRERDEFHRIWKNTGICPQSSAYKVEPSSWLSSLATSLQSRLTHLLFVGHSLSVQVLCCDYRSESKASRFEERYD